MKCGKKRLSLCLLVLVLVSCSLWAFPGRKPVAPELVPSVSQEVQEEILPQVQEEVKEVEEEVPAVEAPSLPVVEEQLSESMSQENSVAISNELKSLSADLDEKSRISGKTLDDLKATLSLISAGVDAVTADRDELLALYQGQLEANAKQADDLAYLRGAYDKEKKAKAFAKVGAVIGFEEMLPTWGVSASLGARFGKGFLLEAGAQYMIGTFTPGNLIYDTPSLDNLAITTSIGWEW